MAKKPNTYNMGFRNETQDEPKNSDGIVALAGASPMDILDRLIKRTSKLGRKEDIITTWAKIFLSLFFGGMLSCIFEIIKEHTHTSYWILLIIFITLSAFCGMLIIVYKNQEQTNIKQIQDDINIIIKNAENYSIDSSYICGDYDIDWDIVYERCIVNKEPLHKKIIIIILFLTLPSYVLALPTNWALKTTDYFISSLAVLSISIASIALYTCFKSLKRERKIEQDYIELKEKYFNTITILDKTTPSEAHNTNYKEILTRGKELLQTGDIRSSLNLFNNAIIQNPKQYLSYEYRADAYSQLGNAREALSDYNRAISLTNKENGFRIIHKIATIHNKLGNTIEAELNYAKAFKILTEKEVTYKKALDDTDVINMLNDYGNFLLRLTKLSDAERIFSMAMDKCHQSSDSNNAQELLAMTLNNSSLLHKKLYQLDKAEDEAEQAHQKYRILAANAPEKHLPDVAMSLNNLANIHADINNLAAAEEEYTEALSIRRQLAMTNPNAYLPNVATILNNLANLHSNTNHYAAAEEEYAEALNIRRQLAESNPSTFLPDVATTLNNLAILHANTNHQDTAEKEFTEALSIRRSLAKTNPDAFLPDVAMTLNNLAVLHKNTNNYTAAEKEYTEALRTYRSLAEANPNAFLPDVAMTLNNLAVLHKNTNNYAAAEKEYTEALRTYRSLAKVNPDAYLPDVATTLNNLAALYHNTNNYAAAEEEYTKAFRTYHSLAEANPDAYLPDVATTLNVFHDNATTKKKYFKAQGIRSQLAKTNPYVFQPAQGYLEAIRIHPDVFQPGVADTLRDRFYRYYISHAAIEMEYAKALGIYRQLAKTNPYTFLPDVAHTLFNMALLHCDKGELDKAEAAAKESLEIYRTMAEKSPAAFDPKVKMVEKFLAEIQEAAAQQHGAD